MIGKYCGQSTPPSLISSSHQVFLHFESDETSAYNGFKLEYHAFSKLSFSQREGVASVLKKKYFENSQFKMAHFENLIFNIVDSTCLIMQIQ